MYKEHCGYCHRDDLIGGGSEAGAPPLKGPIFTIRWRDQPLADMFVTIGTTMPQNKPDTLTPQIVIDIISFLLQEQRDAARLGRSCPPDLEALKSVFMEYRRVRRSSRRPPRSGGCLRPTTARRASGEEPAELGLPQR